MLLGPEGDALEELAAARMSGRDSGREDRKVPPDMNARGKIVHVPVLCILTSSMVDIRMVPMRTTLTIEPDVGPMILLREMRRTDKSMKAVVTDAARACRDAGLACFDVRLPVSDWRYTQPS